MYKNRELIFDATSCGENCAKWIIRISKEKDLTINLHHIMDFSLCEGFEAFIANTKKKVNSYKEYLDEAIGIEER